MGLPEGQLDFIMRNFRGYPLAGGQFEELFPARCRGEFSPGLPVRELDSRSQAEVLVGDRSFRALQVAPQDETTADFFTAEPDPQQTNFTLVSDVTLPRPVR